MTTIEIIAEIVKGCREGKSNAEQAINLIEMTLRVKEGIIPK